MPAAFALPEVPGRNPRFPRYADNHYEILLGYLNIADLATRVTAPDDEWDMPLDELGDMTGAAQDIIRELRSDEGSWRQRSADRRFPHLAAPPGHPSARARAAAGVEALDARPLGPAPLESDIAILEASPVPNAFEPSEPRRSQRACAKPCAYYWRLGFQRWHTDVGHNLRPGGIMVLELGHMGIDAKYTAHGPRVL